MKARDVIVAQVSLALLATLSVCAQILLVAVAVQTGQDYPEVAHLVGPYSVAAVATVGSGQVLLICLSRLLAEAAKGPIGRGQAQKWLKVAQVAVVVGVAIPLAVCVHLLFFVQLGGPAVVIGIPTSLIVGFAGVSCLAVLRKALGRMPNADWSH